MLHGLMEADDSTCVGCSSNSAFNSSCSKRAGKGSNDWSAADYHAGDSAVSPPKCPADDHHIPPGSHQLITSSGFGRGGGGQHRTSSYRVRNRLTRLFLLALCELLFVSWLTAMHRVSALLYVVMWLAHGPECTQPGMHPECTEGT